MTSMTLRLRSVAPESAALRQAVAQWRAAGAPVDFFDADCVTSKPENAPRHDARYIAFRAAGIDGFPEWEGMIRCDEWLAHAAPALAGMALPAGVEEAALDLFAATPQPFAAALPYRTITAGGLVCGEQLRNKPLAMLHAAEATIWLSALPALPAQQTASNNAAWTHDIPATLQFLLGASRISRGRAMRIAPGDVLLVTDHALRMRCNGLVLGWYSITEKGIIVDEQLNQAFEDNPAAATQAAPEEEQGMGMAQDGLARIPVRLEFVLQQNQTTIGALGQLHGGQVIDLAPDAEKSILVLANGALLGRGELVQLEDRLGVEMIDIYGGADRAD